MKIILLILIPFLSFTQVKVNDFVIPDDAMHFYGAVAVGETSSGIQRIFYPDRKLAKRLFIDWLISQAAIFGKEIYDCYKANPTGFGILTDVPPGQLGTHARLMFTISINDFKTRRVSPRKISSKKYILD